MILGSLAFAGLLAEVGIRVYLHTHTFYDIEMSRYATHAKQLAHPRIGHVHRPFAQARLMDVDVRINSDGLRDVEHSLAKEGRYRIAFLGDSLTFGWGVDVNDTFKVRLEQMLNRDRPTEILNFGTGNYNTDQEVALFLDKGLKYSPDKVVIFYFINDAEATPRQSSLAFLDYSRMITFYWSRVNALLSNVSKTNSFQTYYSDLYRENQRGWQVTKRAFLEIKSVCDQHKVELQVVLLPELHELQNYPFKKEHEQVLDYLRANQISALDLAPFFAGETNPHSLWVALDDAHPNALAHARIAQYAKDFISQGVQRNGHTN